MGSTNRLTGVILRSCRSIAGPIEAQFPSSGLVLLRALNKDTGGSSGGGKTSLLLGIAYGLGYCPVPATSLQTWDAQEPLEVQLSFDGPQGPAKLTRGKKCAFAVANSRVAGSVSAVENALEQYLGLSPNLLEALTYRGQKKPSLFLAMKHDAKTEFLASVIPELSKFETAAADAEAKAKATQTLLVPAEAQLEYQSKHVSALKDDLRPVDGEPARLAAEAADEAKARLDAATTALQLQQNAMDALRKKVAADVEELRESRRASGRFLFDKLEIARTTPVPPADETELQVTVARLVECKRRLEAAQKADAEKQRVAAAEQAARQVERSQWAAKVARKRVHLSAVQVEEEGLQRLEANTCPTCERPWHNQEREVAHVKERLEQARAALADCEDAERKLATAAPLETAFTPNPAIEKLVAASQSLTAKAAVERAALAAAKQTHEAKRTELVNRAQSEIITFKAQGEAAEHKLTERYVSELVAQTDLVTAATASVASANDRYRAADTAAVVAKTKHTEAVKAFKAAREKHAAAVTSHAEQEAHCQKLRTVLAQELDLAAALGSKGFLGAIFDEILLEIASETNAILAAVPNTAHIVFRFESETMTSKGETKKMIKPALTVRGHDTPLEVGVSGGQSTAIELAVDLAVLAVVSRRTGISPGWLILDESFTGLGLVEKEACMDILSNFAKDRLVIVVDHDTVFKEMFTQTIDLEFEAGVTTLRSESV